MNTAPVLDAPAPAPRTPSAWRVPVLLVLALLVAGLVLGLIWEMWSPAGPRGAVLKAGIQADENESFIAGDGRFALLTALVGALAGAGAWYLRAQRGTRVALALALGGIGGSLLTDAVGHLLRGEGSRYACASETGRCISELPLWVQAHGLLFLEATVAVLVYSLFVAFAVADDLGRPDPYRLAREARAAALRDWPPPVGPDGGSVGPDGQIQLAGPDGDRARVAQQDDLAAQGPDQPGQPRGSGGFRE